MCLYIKKSAKQKIVLEDIVCYKLVYDGKSIFCDETGLHTMFQDAHIKIGETYESEIIRKKSNENKDLITEGLHSFTTLRNAKFYGHRNYLDMTTYQLPIYIVQCIIPKYSEFYKGTFEGECPSYASSKLKYVKIIK